MYVRVSLYKFAPIVKNVKSIKMSKLITVFNEFKKIDHTLSIEEERDIIAKYVHSTNQLEGNQLTLAQTKTIIDKGVLSGENINLKDVLEQKGTFKALLRMINAVINKEPLSIELIKELNWLCLGLLYQDDYYLSYKKEGQKQGNFKVKNNRIEITLSNGEVIFRNPISTEKTVETNIKMLVKQIENNEKDVIDKAAFLAQEIWLHQPFMDGNKRTGRLLINFLTMKEGFPLFAYNDKGVLFNSMLVEQCVYSKPNLIQDFISNALINRMEEIIKLKPNNPFKGFRFVL